MTVLSELTLKCGGVRPVTHSANDGFPRRRGHRPPRELNDDCRQIECATRWSRWVGPVRVLWGVNGRIGRQSREINAVAV